MSNITSFNRVSGATPFSARQIANTKASAKYGGAWGLISQKALKGINGYG